MMNGFGSWPMHWFGGFGGPGFFAVGGIVFFLLVFWSVIWKGLALWKAARLGSKAWFVVLLLVNTLGLLEILYIYVFSKKAESTQQPEQMSKPQ